jgi:hypothetical protein
MNSMKAVAIVTSEADEIENDLEVENESDARRTRILILEAALACIGREAQLAEDHPELSFFAAQRIAAVVRQSLERGDAPVSHVRPIVRARG